MYAVYLTIVNEDSLYRGCGAWGSAATIDEARKIAKKHLRESFGTGLKTTEKVVTIDEDEG